MKSEMDSLHVYCMMSLYHITYIGFTIAKIDNVFIFLNCIFNESIGTLGEVCSSLLSIYTSVCKIQEVAARLVLVLQTDVCTEIKNYYSLPPKVPMLWLKIRL